MEEDQISNNPEKFSFDWYADYKDKFFHFLVKAFLYADNNNLLKLSLIFEYISLAKLQPNWTKRPITNRVPIINIQRDDIKKSKT